jgi:hypothetical protein
MPGGGSQPGRSGSVLDGLSLPDALRIKIMRISRPLVVSPVTEPQAERAGRGGRLHGCPCLSVVGEVSPHVHDQ